MVRIANCSIEEFERQALSHDVICFGAGGALRRLCREYRLLDRVLYAVDNYKSGSVAVDGRTIPLRSMAEVGAEAERSVWVITSDLYLRELIEQLEAQPRLDGALVFCPDFLMHFDDRIEIDADREPVIPKKIHYCWFGGGELPPRYRENIESWRRVCPDYEIIRWDESNYDVGKNRYMRQAYEKKKWAFVSDYARVDVIHRHGGVYLDTDIEVVKPFDSLLGYEMFCGFQDRWLVAFGLGFGAVKNHPVLGDLLRTYEELSFVREDGTLNAVPCPVYQTEALKRHGLLDNGLCQRGEHFIALSPQYLSPFTPRGFGWVTEHTYSIHQYAGAWLNEAESGRIAGEKDFFVKRGWRIPAGGQV